MSRIALVRLAAVGYAAVLAVGLPLCAQTQGKLELTSGLGRPLYALPDDQAEKDAKQAVAAAPSSAAAVLALAKAQAAHRPRASSTTRRSRRRRWA